MLRLALVGVWLLMALSALATYERNATLWELYATDWLLPPLFVLTVASLLVLLRGPESWRATRWAWFWLICSPVGLLAFPVLSGRTPVVPPPRPPERRLTGGSALSVWWLS